MAAHGSKSRAGVAGWGGMLELSSASVASLPLDAAELLEPIDIGRFFGTDMVVIMTASSCYLPDERVEESVH